MVTESSHLRTLRVLDLIFYQRMRKESLLPREELVQLFPNLPELIEIHSEEPLLPLPNLGPRESRPLEPCLMFNLKLTSLSPQMLVGHEAGCAHSPVTISALFVTDSWCEAMRKLREEGPIIRDIGDLMLARVRLLGRGYGWQGGVGVEGLLLAGLMPKLCLLCFSLTALPVRSYSRWRPSSAPLSLLPWN